MASPPAIVIVMKEMSLFDMLALTIRGHMHLREDEGCFGPRLSHGSNCEGGMS